MHSRFRCLGKLGLFLVILIAFVPRPAVGLIMGGKGNKLVKDPGWPEGAEAIFNNRGRIAYWVADGIEGWHADCRGDAEALSAVLADYAKLDVEPKRVVVHDGLGNSYLLNPTRLEKADTWTQWTFMVQLRPEVRKRRGAIRFGVGRCQSPPVHLDVYAGGELKWEDVVIPKGLLVVDKRLEAHGFELRDKIVRLAKVAARRGSRRAGILPFSSRR